MGALTEVWVAGFRTVDDGRTSVANYVWDTGSLSWVVQTGGGAGPTADVNVTNASLAVTQSGAWSVGITGSVAVTGPLTDAELRASAVPVSLASTTITGSVAVTGPLTDAQLRASPVPTKEVRAATNTRSSVSGAAVDTLLLASNANRLGATFFNESSAILYLALGTTAASLTNYTVQMVTGAYYEVPFAYTGEIRGIWASATGAVRVGEIT